MRDLLDQISDVEKKAKILLLYKIGVFLSYVFIALGLILFFLYLLL